ncbi:MAG: tetratricopeptide repeat protein [Acidobacteria bacterium]|nr:tetratricopeptide repeat protein [Acidobacteriota bacterium]MYE44926.1 tetratricopeptide repeat protein [Acidobacteriota bacterium]
MTALVLSVLFVAVSGTIQPDATLRAEARRLLQQQDYASALEVLDAAGPKGAQPEFLRYWAEAYVGLLDYPAAVAVLESAPPEPENLALRIRLLAILSRDDEARRVLAELLALGGRLADGPRLRLAMQLRVSGLVSESRRLVGAPTAADSPALTLEHGRLRLAEDDYEGALPFLASAASAEEPPVGAAYEFGRCLALLGRREEAMPWLRKAVSESPDDSLAHFRLGQLLLQDSDPHLVAEGRRLLSGHEESRLRGRRRDLLLTRLNEHSVVRGSSIDRTPGLVTGSRDGWVELVGLLLDRGEAIEATRVVQAASVRYPGDPAFDIGRARAHLQLGNLDAAAEVLTPLVPALGEPLDGASLSAARWLADVRLRGGDPAAAAALFDRVLEAGGQGISPRIRAAAATAFAMSGNPARALTLFGEVLDRTGGPARAGPLSDSALVLEMLGRPSEAESRYRQSLQADPAHTPASLGLAELLLRTGRSGEAAAVVRAALEHAPQDAALRELLSRTASPGAG